MNRRILIAAFQALASLSWFGRGSRVSTSPLERFEVRRISYLKSSYAVSITGPCPTGVITANRSSLLCSFEDRNEHPAPNRCTTLLIEIYLRFRRFFDSVMQPRWTPRVIYHHPFSFSFRLSSFSFFLSFVEALLIFIRTTSCSFRQTCNRYRSKLVSSRWFDRPLNTNISIPYAKTTGKDRRKSALLFLTEK